MRRGVDPVNAAALLGATVAGAALIGVVEATAIAVLIWAIRRWPRYPITYPCDSARLVGAVVTGVGVALITLESGRDAARWDCREDVWSMRRYSNQVVAYVNEHDRLPPPDETIDNWHPWLDRWGRPLIAERIGANGVRVIALGADGARGGRGRDQDLAYETGLPIVNELESVPPTLSEFPAYESFGPTVAQALIGGLLAFGIVYLGGQPSAYKRRVSQQVNIVLGTLLILGLAAGLGWAMAIVAYPSGH